MSYEGKPYVPASDVRKFVGAYHPDPRTLHLNADRKATLPSGRVVCVPTTPPGEPGVGESAWQAGETCGIPHDLFPGSDEERAELLAEMPWATQYIDANYQVDPLRDGRLLCRSWTRQEHFVIGGRNAGRTARMRADQAAVLPPSLTMHDTRNAEQQKVLGKYPCSLCGDRGARRRARIRGGVNMTGSQQRDGEECVALWKELTAGLVEPWGSKFARYAWLATRIAARAVAAAEADAEQTPSSNSHKRPVRA